MSRRANPALVGGFVATALAILTAAAVYLGAARFGGNWYNFSIYFEGSAAGLQIGAPVVLKGVTIGTVTSIQVGFYPEEEDFIVPVEIRVDSDKILLPEGASEDFTVSQLIEQGLRARLDLQSILTGQLRVDLGFFPDTEVQYRGRPARYPEIPSIPSALETLRQALEEFPARELAASVLRIVNGLDKVVNSPRIAQILDDLQAAIADIRALAESLERRTGPLAENADLTVREIRQLVAETRSLVDRLGEDLEASTEDARLLMENLRSSADPALADFRAAMGSAQSAFKAADSAFRTAEGMIGKESAVRHEILTLLKNLSEAARSLKIMADYLERHPDALIRGKR